MYLSEQCRARTLRTRPKARRHLLLLAVGALLLLAVPAAAVAPASASSPGSGWATAHASPSRTGSAAVHPAAFNPPCAPVISGVCVSIQNPNEYGIVPASGHSSSVEPPWQAGLPLVVKSATPLNWTYNAKSGPNSPITLNVTGVLWNGDIYYNQSDGTTYHGPTQAYWTGPIPVSPANSSYPWWYLVNISGYSATGAESFFAGMSISWWIEITSNVSGVYYHQEGPHYHFTYGGAWPESPYRGAAQSDGAAAYGQDVETTVVPSQPNWNDAVHLTLNTTALDRPVNASLGQAVLDLTEYSQNGSVVATETYSATPAGGVGGGIGVHSLRFTVPASLSQEAGATVRYALWASDAWGNWVTSGPQIYVVGGNGSFALGHFANDLNLTWSPAPAAGATLAPGTPVNLTLKSTNVGTAIASATVFYSVDLPELNVSTQSHVAFTRINSTSFVGQIPGLPVGAGVSFSVTAVDFTSQSETSSVFQYSVASLSDVLPAIESNQTFFFVAVHDAGTGQWVSGATVSILGPGGYLHTSSTTVSGLAYPGETGNPLAPIIVPAGAVYTLNVSDPTFRPPGSTDPPPVSVQFLAPHNLGGHAFLEVNATYSVVQEGDLLVFWLNSSAASPSAAASDLTPVVTVGAVGLGATALVLLPLIGWWRRIQRRREEEVKRVTL